jgi:hypothetical protein
MVTSYNKILQSECYEGLGCCYSNTYYKLRLGHSSITLGVPALNHTKNALLMVVAIPGYLRF